MKLQPQQPGKQWQWPGGFRRSLLAVVAGNALYYSTRGYLPEGALHRPFLFDWGLLVDLWFCVAVYGITLLVWPRRKA